MRKYVGVASRQKIYSPTENCKYLSLLYALQEKWNTIYCDFCELLNMVYWIKI